MLALHRIHTVVHSIIATFLLTCVLIGMVIVLSYVRPSIHDVEVQSTKGEWHRVSVPYISFLPDRLQFHLRFFVRIPSPRSQTTFILTVRSRMDAFRVNGRSLPIPSSHVALADDLHVGDNTIESTVSLTSNPLLLLFAMEPSLWHWSTFALMVAVFSAFSLWMFILPTSLFRSLPRPVSFIVLFGTFLRVLYAVSTPAFLRSYDSDGHLQYIQFLLTHHRLPLAGEIWQGHQAPLFYILSLPFAGLAHVFHLDVSTTTLLLQLFPLILSVCTLLIGTAIMMRHCSSLSLRIMGSTVIAVFPALIFLSSQISNDALLTFFGFLWYGCLLSALHDKRLRSWFLVGACVGLGVLTKANALPWLFISFVFIVLYRSSALQCVRSFVALLIASFSCGGWWYVLRILSRPHFSLAENAFQQVSTVILTPSLHDILAFNPIAILLHPSANSFDALSRSQNFLETLFRTSQVGSLHFADTGMLLLVAMALCLLILWGVRRECRIRHCVHSMTAFLFVLSILLFRLRYPFATAQHFRYITPVIVPLTLLLVSGVSALTPRFLRILAEATIGVYALLVTILVLSVALYA